MSHLKLAGSLAALVLAEAGGHVFDLEKRPLNAPLDVKKRLALVAVGVATVRQAGELAISAT